MKILCAFIYVGFKIRDLQEYSRFRRMQNRSRIRHNAPRTELRGTSSSLGVSVHWHIGFKQVGEACLYVVCCS